MVLQSKGLLETVLRELEAFGTMTATHLQKPSSGASRFRVVLLSQGQASSKEGLHTSAVLPPTLTGAKQMRYNFKYFAVYLFAIAV